jgi:3-deoxy-manno-octulosonate cytidylyltransferase (CMP-KDO synthetase)
VVTKIVRRSVLAGILDELRRGGKKIVFTNGCFDILHVGHVRYLEEARQLGDCLVVGLNTDDSVRGLKGSERPFIPEFERAELLAALQCVNYVVLFAEPTAIKLLGELRPDIYVKGGDYTSEDQIPEADTVKAIGGKIVMVSGVEGKSTSDLISRIRKSSAASDSRQADRGPVAGIIPARLAATRLPNKPLLDIAGKPMIQWVYEQASKATMLDEVMVATPDEEVRKCVESFGGKAIMTSSEHRSGTDRLAEAAEDSGAGLIVNIQGDEPLLDPDAIDLLVRAMVDSPDVLMGSLMCPLADDEEEDDPAVVKVVTDREGFALYFSRARIPYPRDPNAAEVRKHIGIYAYQRDFLIAFSRLAPTPLEQAESLEQLRALENGYRIKMVETDFSPMSVDTPEDLERVRQLFLNVEL